MDSEIALRGKGVGKYGSPMSSGFAAIFVSARPMEKRVPLPNGYRRATLTRPQNETEGMHQEEYLAEPDLTDAEKGGIMHPLPEPVSPGKFTSKTSALWQILYVSTRLPP